MPLITETYYLSLTQDNRGILRLRCSQDDTLRTVNLKLYNNGSIFVIPSGISASISGVKQNGAVFSKPCTISQNRESVVLQLSSDITNVDGIIVAEIVLNDGEGGRLGTSNFIIQVEKNPIRAGVVQDTETPIEYINDFIEKIQTLTARLNNLITPSGDASLAEVVDARIGILDSTTYQTLGARLNAEFQRLSNALSGITILESTGDTTDRTSEILSKLNAYGICKLGKGDFYVNGLVMPEDSMLVGSGKSTRIILPTSVTSGHVVKPRSGCIIENISFSGGFTGTYSELIASGSSAQRHCIILDRFDNISSENVILNNIFINNFVGSAIIQRYTVGCHCEDVIINMCYAGIDISNASYDGQLVNVSMSNTRFGVVQNGSNFVFTNCVSKDSAYHIMSDQQNTGCTFSSCSFSESSLETTSKLASISNAREGFVFDNCLFDSSLSMLLNACDGIVIKGTNFVGSDTFVITVSNGRNTLLFITDCIADVEPVVTNAGTVARITSCYLKDGTAWIISEADIIVDDELSDESENPVQNKVINREISEIKADLNEMVRVVPQTLTEAQKTQAKVNLGIDETDSDAIKALQTDVDDIVDTLLDVTAKLGNASGGSSESSNLVSAIILEILSKGVYIEQMREKLWEAQLEMNPDKIRQLTAFTGRNISDHTFYIGDDVNAIRPYITVSAQTTDGYIVSVTSYELVGSLSNTSNTITVKYHGKTATVVIEAVTNPNGILYDWDFTQSLQDLRQNKTAILVGEAMRDSSGLKVTLPGRCKLFERDFNASQELLNKTIRIEVSSFKQLDTIGHYRFLMFSDPKTNKTSSEGGDDGLVCRRSGDNAYAGWSWYNNQAWKTNIFTGMASPTIISGSRINIYIASDGTLTLYLNGTSKGSLDTKFNATDHFGIMIGNKYSIGLNSGNGNFEAIITSFKIYNGLVTS